MNNVLASRLSAVKPSPSMIAKARVDALRAQGRTIIDLTLGEPDFPTPAHIVQGGIDALNNGETRYTSTAGTPAVRRAICDKLSRENGLAFDPTEVVVGCGAKHIIYNAFSATLNDGDEVIVPAPYWVSYPDMVAINGGTPVIVACDASAGFKLTAAALQRAITPKTRWVILNSPNNPSGAVYSQCELEALCGVLNQHPRIWIMSDEIYEHFVFGQATHLSPLNVDIDLRSRTLIVNGMSKAFAMTGWRIGYGAGPVSLIKAITLLLSQSTSCASAMGQAAAVVALYGPQQCVADAAELFGARRDTMVTLLNAIDGIDCSVPDGAFYIFPSVAGLIGRWTPQGKCLLSDVDVMNYFLECANVATIDGASYGLSPHIRMSFAAPIDQITAGCAAIALACEGCTTAAPASMLVHGPVVVCNG